MLSLHRLTSCTLLQLRTSRGYLIQRPDSFLNRKNSLTYIAEERTRIIGKHMSRDHHQPLRDVTADTENTAFSIVACWTVFTELLPGNALIKCVTICYNQLLFYSFNLSFIIIPPRPMTCFIN
jgi:hypothetical protein